ncbi:MAG TPA: efflux RND transporter periplasmic adaptor subunit [Candidatus Obscuribacterales bacterium]
MKRKINLRSLYSLGENPRSVSSYIAIPTEELPKLRWIQVVMAGLLITLTGCGILPKETAEAQSRRPGTERGNKASNVDVAIARTGSLRKDTEYTGTTVPWQEVSVRSQVEGKLLQLNANVGSPVRRGQILAQLDDTILLTAVTQAEAELATLQSEVARARTLVNNARTKIEQARLEQQQALNDAARYQKLVSAGAISKQQAEISQTAAGTATQALRSTIQQVSTEQQAVAAAESRVTAQRAAVAQARERLSYRLLTSPINGVVLQQVIQTGNLVQPGSEILKLGDFSLVKVVVQLSELELSKIRVGQSVQVRLDAFPNEKLTGQIALISPAADPASRLIPVEITIPNSNGRIGSGLLARVSFSQASGERVIVPQSALMSANQRGSRGGASRPAAEPGGVANPKSESQNSKSDTVFVVTGEGKEAKVVARQVTLGDRANNQVEIISGLEPGERFVSRSSKPLKDGETVRLSVLSESSSPIQNPKSKIQNRDNAQQ